MKSIIKKPRLISVNSRFRVRTPFICLFSIAVFLGCKKEEALTQNKLQSLIQPNDQSLENDGLHSLMVHKGGSIQAAVDAAKPGSVIHIEAGIYTEAVTVTKAGLKLIGVTSEDEGEGDEHAGVIIQNPGQEKNGITVTKGADGIQLKNLTVKGFDGNGVFLTGIDGFLISHVRALYDGEYGIFPVHCTHGVIEHCTAIGHNDTGIYVGQSSEVEILSNKASANVSGIEIENSSHIIAKNNNCFDNVGGLLVFLLPGLDVTTSSDIHVSHNIVTGNNRANFGKPGDLVSVVPSGIGILVLGADKTEVESNFIKDNNFVGIAVFSSLVLGALANIPPSAFTSIDPNPDGTEIVKNTLIHNGTAPPPLPIPLPGVDLLWDGSGNNNCWRGNIFTSSYPSPLPACN